MIYKQEIYVSPAPAILYIDMSFPRVNWSHSLTLLDNLGIADFAQAKGPKDCSSFSFPAGNWAFFSISALVQCRCGKKLISVTVKTDLISNTNMSELMLEDEEVRVRKGELLVVGREYWIMYRWPAFPRRRLVWHLYAPLSCEQLSLFIGLLVCRRSSLLRERGRSRILWRRESLFIYKSFNTLWLVIDCVVGVVGCRSLFPLLEPCSIPGWASSQLHCSICIFNSYRDSLHGFRMSLQSAPLLNSHP